MVAYYEVSCQVWEETEWALPGWVCQSCDTYVPIISLKPTPRQETERQKRWNTINGKRDFMWMFPDWGTGWRLSRTWYETQLTIWTQPGKQQTLNNWHQAQCQLAGEIFQEPCIPSNHYQYASVTSTVHRRYLVCPQVSQIQLPMLCNWDSEQLYPALYAAILSHSIFCLVTGSCRLRPLKAFSLKFWNPRFNSSWYFLSITAICFTISGELADDEREDTMGLSVRSRTLPSS